MIMTKFNLNRIKTIIFSLVLIKILFISSVSVPIPLEIYGSDLSTAQITIVVPSVGVDNKIHLNLDESNMVLNQEKHELVPVMVYENIDEYGRNIIIKRYELSQNEKAENIPTEDFVIDNITYTLRDIIEEENSNIEIKTVSEVVQKVSPSNNLEQVIGVLDEQIKYDDGKFYGFLSLDVSSIRVEEGERQTNSRLATITRDYPHLSNRDTALIPKAINEGGVTYTLTDVSWVTDNTVAVDYTQVGEHYTAKATYSGVVYSTNVTSYTVTASYSGEVSYTNTDIKMYNAIFTEVPYADNVTTEDLATINNQEIEITEDKLISNFQQHWKMVLIMLPLLFLLIGVVYFVCTIYKRYKGNQK